MSADSWEAAVNAAGATVPAAVKSAVAAALAIPAFAKVIDFALFAGPSTLAGALVPVISSGALSAWPSSGLDSGDYIPTGTDCGINAYKYIEFAGIADGPAPKTLGTGTVAMDAVGGFFVVGSTPVNLGGANWISKNGDHPRLYQSSAVNMVTTISSWSDFSEVPGRLHGDVVLVRQSNTAARTYLNGTQVAELTGLSTSVPTAGEFRLLVGAGANSLGSRITSFVVFNGATYTEALAIRSAVLDILIAAGYKTGVTTYLAAGDSQAAGFDGAVSWSDRIKASKAGRHLNAGLNGRTITELAAAYVNQGKTYRPDPTYSTSGWYMPMCGTNDLGAGVTGATAFANLQAHWAAAAADGWQVVKFTIAPRNDTGWDAAKETQRQAFNTLVRADATAGTYLIDIAATPGLTNPDDGVNYQADKLHFSTAGNILIANTLRDALWPNPPGAASKLSLRMGISL